MRMSERVADFDENAVTSSSDGVEEGVAMQPAGGAQQLLAQITEVHNNMHVQERQLDAEIEQLVETLEQEMEVAAQLEAERRRVDNLIDEESFRVISLQSPFGPISALSRELAGLAAQLDDARAKNQLRLNQDPVQALIVEEQRLKKLLCETRLKTDHSSFI